MLAYVCETQRKYSFTKRTTVLLYSVPTNSLIVCNIID